LERNDKVQVESDGVKSVVKEEDDPIIERELEEEDTEFHQLSKGDEMTFDFCISESHIGFFFNMLNQGLPLDCQRDYSNWICACEGENLMATCLLSTFVGMCIPGKYATFLDFSVDFLKPVRKNKRYKLSGKVKFKSETTLSLLESVEVHDLEGEQQLCMSGKLNAKVNEPPVTMPSISSLNKNGLDLGLKGKVVLITGASRGIGEMTAKMFALYSSKVAVNYFRGKDDAERIISEITEYGGEAIAVCADVSDRSQTDHMISTVFDRFGAIHIMVNNAVRDARSIPFMELTWDDVQKDIDVTVKGAFNCCQGVLPSMKKNGGGRIINVSTIFADYPPPDQSKYVVSKSALVGLTRSLAVEFAASNILVNMVVPSIVETDLTKHVPKMVLKGMENDVPMKRLASPLDVAKAVIFLASSLASFTSGQKIMVTGANPPLL